MSTKPSIGATLFGHGIVGVVGVLVICCVFAVFVPGPERGPTFYVAAGIVCAAWLTLFIHLAHSKLAARGVPTASPPTRILISFLAIIWLVAAVLAAIFALDPERADTMAADRVFMIYLVLAFLFFAAAYFIYSKDIEVEAEDREVAKARRNIQFNIPDVESVMRSVDAAGDEFPEQAALVERVHRKLDSLRIALEGVLVSASAGDQLRSWDTEISEQITELIRLGNLPQDEKEIPDKLEAIARHADLIMVTVGKRERAMMA